MACPECGAKVFKSRIGQLCSSCGFADIKPAKHRRFQAISQDCLTQTINPGKKGALW